MGANKATTAAITTEAHHRNHSQSERGIEQEAEIYCAAWALVLARHGGDIVEDGQADVSFGCAVGAGEQARIDAPPLLKGEHQHSAADVRILHLAFSPDQSLAGFVQYVKTKLKTLAGAKKVNKRDWETLTAPLKSVLRIGGGGAALSDEEEGSVKPTTTFCIDIPGYTVVDAREPAIQVHPENSAVTKILIAHLRQALQCLRTLPPSTPVSQVDLFSNVDRKHLMELNKEPAPCVDDTLTGLFARQVHLQPTAPAVCSWDRNLSYAELDGLSNKLASELIRKGASPEESVALCFEKSALAIIAMTAVLKTGANFVNLGISMPTQRQSAILAACKATLLIVDAPNEFRLAEHTSISGLCIADFSFIEALPTVKTVLPEVKPHYVAAITFTSGSTGTPKGIVVEHGSIATSCDAMCTRYGVGPGTRILQFASYTFDASVGDIFYALARGACVCSPSEKERVDELAPAARRMAVNWAFLTPSVLSLLEPRDIPSLQTLLLGGEPPSPKHVDLWAKSISLHLVMGPAECAIYCAGSAAIQPGQSSTTFGWAAGCRMWIVDSRDHTKLAPVGCPGELIVEGRTVARGYLHDEERTRKAFLDNVPWLPPSANPLTRRLYKSGDLVRLKIDDGSFSFMARKDTQVKLHGQRVELGEIEQNLKNIITDVRSTAAILNLEAGEINHRHPLIAFLVFAKDSTSVKYAADQVLPLTPSGLDLLRNAKEKLATILPPYMIPSLFIPLAFIPFTANGKRDTAMLRQITQSLSKENIQSYSLSHQIEDGEDTRPLTEKEQQLRKLWASTLHIEETDIGASSDFVEQGGDSLAAMGLVTAASKVGLHLPMSTIMEHSCLSAMASEMNELSSLESDPIPNPFSILSPTVNIDDLKIRCAEQCGIHVDQINDVYPATPIQDMLLNASLRRPGTYILTMKFQLPSSTKLDRFIATWNEVIHSADILRTRLIADPEAGILQVVLNDFAWDIYDTLEEYETQNDHLPMEYGTRLARLSIIRGSLSGKSPIFIFTAHHVLYDAFQLTMTFGRVSELYKTGKHAPLAPFKAYVAHLNSIPLAPILEYWASTLSNPPTTTWPPLTSSTAAAPSSSTIIRSKLNLPVRPTQFTLALYLRAAFTLLYAAKTSLSPSSITPQTRSVCYGTTYSGRDTSLASIHNVCGPTIISIPFLVHISPETTLSAFLASLRNQIEETTKHGHIGVKGVMEASSDAKTACKFNTVFAVQPKLLQVPVDTFGEKIAMDEVMGRLGCVFECFVAGTGEDGRGAAQEIEVVAEFRGVEVEEAEAFVRDFEVLVLKLVSADSDCLIAGLGV